ncbi:MAG TPA: hypothetical protein PLW43_02745 [Chitinophagales bacterium]|nr:hypothetical protein [Chitinophagales bacterium]
MQLKIAAVTNLTDARFFNAIGAAYIGFNFDVLNENNITIEKAKEITGWLFEPVLVGEFGLHQNKEEIAFIAEQLDIHEIQIPFQHPEKALLDFEKFLVLDDWRAVQHQQFSDMIVIRIQQEDIRDEQLKAFVGKNTVFVETDFTGEILQQIAAELQPHGIQITCRKEDKPGLSLVDEYADMLEAIGFS